MDAMKSQGQGGGRGARWMAIMEVVEVEEMAVAWEALTTSVEEVVSEVGQG